MKMARDSVFSSLIAVCAVLFSTVVNAQTSAPKTIFRDSEGRLISNNEFVDIRLANPSYRDATIVTTHEDGTVEFRLQKIPQEGSRAPEFKVRTLEGRTIGSADLRGKVVVLNFWFIGCAVCRAHKPKLNELRSKFAGDESVVFLAVTADPSAAVSKYLEKQPFRYIQGTDAQPTLDAFSFAGFPKNIVISRTGEIVYWRTTISAWEKFESVVREETLK